MEWLGLVLVLGALAGTLPAVVRQYRTDRAGFWKTLRLFALYVLYVLAGTGIVFALLSGPQEPATALAATAFVLAWILYGALWLTRTVPRYRELPAFIDKFPGAIDYAFLVAIVTSLAVALLI